MRMGLRFRWSAAVIACAGLSPEAFATGVGTPNNSQTYSAESIALAVERAVMEFASGAPEDDVAIVVVRPTGDGAGLC